MRSIYTDPAGPNTLRYSRDDYVFTRFPCLGVSWTWEPGCNFPQPDWQVSMSALAICTKPLARQGMPLWHLDRVLDTRGGVHDTSTPAHAGRPPAAQLLRTHCPSLYPHRCRVCEVLPQVP